MVRSIPAGLLVLALAAATTIGVSYPASASEKKTITGVELMRGNAVGDAVFDELTIEKDGVLLVPAYDGAQNLGQIHIHANRITVAAGGTISAVGAGHRGRDGMSGESASGTTGGGSAPMTLGLPGGGGAYAGNGAPGLDAKCAGLIESLGGLSFFDPSKSLTLGSAGGAASISPNPTNRGGNGGGFILLQAAKIVVDGVIDVSGASPPAHGGVAPGGGSGGSLFLHTADLSGNGVLRAMGGNGAHGGGDLGIPLAANNGGGGSGGVIKILGPQRPASLKVELGGGESGDCGVGHHGDDGVEVDEVIAGACVDADGDKVVSSACGGTDCDDSDPAVFPMGIEICNGLDDNCDGNADEGDALCSLGSACVAGVCVAISDGGPPPDAGGDPGPRPDHIGLEGGCALGSPGFGGGAAPFVGLGLSLAWLASSARRRSRSGKAG
jgi:hypothetical protein